MTRPSETAPRTPVRLDPWKVAYIVVIVLALLTRLLGLGDRAVSHDETTHAKYSWNLYSGAGFRHDPLMHGPLLFEVTALLYGIFGVSDFTARLYAALAGVALVAAPWLLRRWMGHLGALFASVMVLISPTLTYYSRYARHDIPMLLFITLLLWSVLKYLDGESKGERWLVWTGIFFALVFATKENAYIYTAIFLALLALPLVWQVLTTRWERRGLVLVVVAAALVTLAALGLFAVAYRGAQIVEEGEGVNAIGAVVVPAWGRLALGASLLAAAGAVIAAVYGVGESRLRGLRLFDVLVVLGSFTLPLGSALLMDLVAGVDMTTFYPALMSGRFGNLPVRTTAAAFGTLAITLAVSVAVGIWWDRRRWPVVALAYYGVFFALYSTLFTYGWGVLSGLVGGLAYWIAQQEVQRGSQPWYYYGMLKALYEYLPLAVSLAGVGLLAYREGQRGYRRRRALVGRGRAPEDRTPEDRAPEDRAPEDRRGSRGQLGDGGRVGADGLEAIGPHLIRLWPVFLVGWAAASWVGYIVAGEKMPWLLAHIAYPHLLLAAWFLDQAFRTSGSQGRRRLRDLLAGSGWLIPVSLMLGILALLAYQGSAGALREALAQRLSADSLELAVAQLQPLGKAIGGLVGLVLCGALLVTAWGRVGTRRALLLTGLAVLVALVGLTVRTTVMAAFINDELAKEYLVYAHATPDVKEVIDRIEAISWRLTGTPDQIQVAYGKETAWPFYWYMYSQFPNNYYFDVPEQERLLASPVILAERSEWESVEAITGTDYDAYDYRHIWWPVEDYKELTWERLGEILRDPERRKAIWDIVWKRDYTRYARLRNPDDPFTLVTWPHRSEFRLYVRRDIANAAHWFSDETWALRASDGELREFARISPGSTGDATTSDGFGRLVGGGTEAEVPLQAYEEAVEAQAVMPLGGASPVGLDVAPDDTLFVADAQGHRVWHLALNGDTLALLGDYGSAPGQFNTPSDVAVDADGNVYVADTWNHRIQKLSPDGEPIARWGRYARVTANDSTGWGALFGPRGIDIGPDGNVYVADTGNNRIQVFDPDGQVLRVFGTGGSNFGQLREPVGIAVDAAADAVAVYVADSWNHRVQVFDGFGFPVREWPVTAWDALELGHRPALEVVDGQVLATDPVYQRILLFTASGEPVQVLRDETRPLQPNGVVVIDDANGDVANESVRANEYIRVVVSNQANPQVSLGAQLVVYPLPVSVTRP